jgi:hypothetical protein
MTTDINFEENELGENPDLQETVEEENELKSFVVQYVGEAQQPEDGNVTVEMVVEQFLTDFPEFLMVVAEENWIRGYQQALSDVEEADRLVQEEDTDEEDNDDNTN